MEDYTEQKEKSSLRKKADNAKKMRCSTLICVLENPKNINNVSSVVRNIDALGIGKLYVVDGFNLLPKGHWKESMRNDKNLSNISVSAIKWTYVRRFDTTKSCIDHIKKDGFLSMVTSPHLKGKDNFDLHEGNFTQKKLAVWFGNESCGISDEAIKESIGCIQIEMGGIVESLNLSVSTGIVLHQIATRRRKFIEEKLINRVQ